MAFNKTNTNNALDDETMSKMLERQVEDGELLVVGCCVFVIVSLCVCVCVCLCVLAELLTL